MKLKKVCLAVIAAVFVAGVACSAIAEENNKIIYIDLNATGTNDGSSWANAFNNFYFAITAARERDTVIVAPGRYIHDQNTNISFYGYTITVRSVDPNNPDIVAATIIDCENTYLSGFSFSNNADSTISGFTIINGYHGIICDQSSPKITNCIISGNNATIFNGGGIRCINNSSPTIINCTIIGNSATKTENLGGNGGGIACEDNSNPQIINCVISKNTSHMGGGIFSNHSHPTIKNCTISENNGVSQGGGVFTGIDGVGEDTPIITNCIINKNHAGEGGGVYGRYGRGITNCTVMNNAANYGGGIFCRTMSNFVVSNCILRKNSPNQIGAEESEWASGTPVICTNIEGGWAGTGNIDADPCFADVDTNDFHLKSQAGRWDPIRQNWAIDAVTSPCIDGGDMASAIGLEPFPNGGRINMGAYGGTAQASKSYFGSAICQTIVAGDINGDCKVNFIDFAILSSNWLWEE
jgi:hypothetical protein